MRWGLKGVTKWGIACGVSLEGMGWHGSCDPRCWSMQILMGMNRLWFWHCSSSVSLTLLVRANILMSTPSKISSKDTGAAKAQLAAMEVSWAWLWAQLEREEREMEAVIAAEVERVAEEERLVEAKRRAEAEHRWRAEEAERQWVLEEHCQQVEAEQGGSSVEVVAGLSKKKKIQETVSDKLSEEKSTNTTNRERWSKWGV